MPGHESQQFPEYLTLRQAVDLGYAGYSTLRKYIADGRLPAFRSGRGYRLKHADLDSLLSSDTRSVEVAVERVVAAAPSLSVEQVRLLGSIFGTLGTATGASNPAAPSL